MPPKKRSRVEPVRRRKRVVDHDDEEHGSEERWMVSYADMVTLLLVLFIVLYAMSQIDISKYTQFKDGMISGFGRSADILSGRSAMLDNQGADTQGAQMVDPQMITNVPAQETQEVKTALAAAAMQAKQRSYADAEAQVKSLLALWHRMQAALARQGLDGDVQASVDERGLVVSLVSKHVVFPANLATLTDRGDRILDAIAPVLSDISEPIEIDGHTNQVKVKPKYYPDDWGLSSDRALAALRHLQNVDGIAAKRLQASGFGHTKPLENPSIPGSQQINKRVDIVVLSQAPAETRALYKQAYAELQKSQQKKTGDQP